MDVPERIWICPNAHQRANGSGEWMAEFWGLPTETPYILATPAALAASPEVQALIREAEAERDDALTRLAAAEAQVGVLTSLLERAVVRVPPAFHSLRAEIRAALASAAGGAK